MKEAIQKIDRELKALKGDKYVDAMKIYVAGRLKEFCAQNEEFARAVLQGGTFGDCMSAVRRAVHGASISDLDACRAAAEFYFPGSVVEFRMEIRMSKYEAEEQAPAALNLRLEDLL